MFWTMKNVHDMKKIERNKEDRVNAASEEN